MNSALNSSSLQTTPSTPLALGEALGRCQTVRQKIYTFLLDPEVEGNKHQQVDGWISFLIIINLFALVVERIPAIFQAHEQLFHVFDVFSVIVFTIEYLMRLYLAPEDKEFKNKWSARGAYVLSPFAVIDFLAVAPFYFQAFLPIDLRVLRFLRLLRMLKLFRVLIPAYHEFMALNAKRTFRQKMYSIVFPSEYGGAIHDMFESLIAWWVVISVIAVVFESVESIHYVLSTQFLIIDSIAVGLFTVEYFLKLYTCVEDPVFKKWFSGRVKHSLKFSSIIDLLAIAPFFLELFLHHLFDLRFLRVFRLMRLLKITKQNNSTAVLKRVFTRETPILAAALFVMMLMVVLAASLAYLMEHDSQPDKYENIPSAVYWAVVTLSSVGYGDLTPVTPIGRIMTILMAVIGVGIFAIPSALLASSFSDELHSDKNNLGIALYNRLKQGLPIDLKNEFVINEGKRLNLSPEQLKGVIDKVLYEFNMSENLIPQPLRQIANNTDQALEHYVKKLSRIRQLGILIQHQPAETMQKLTELLSPSEAELWKQIQGSPQFLKT